MSSTHHNAWVCVLCECVDGYVYYVSVWMGSSMHTLVDGQVDMSQITSSCYHVLWYGETDGADPGLTGNKLCQPLWTETGTLHYGLGMSILV